ncbi:MAG: hypothetical protein Q8L48_37135 [Archangium sp.]|nr:hypothetical protein [Archangium sp.]
MRLNPVARQPFSMSRYSQPAAASQPASSRVLDSFVSAAPRVEAKAPSATKQALAAVGQSALDATLNALVEKLSQALGRALEKFFAKLSPQAPALPAPAAPVNEPVAPSAPAPVGGGLAPTPLAKEVPGQVAYVNTIKEPGIAPKSVFRNAVNAAIDAVRAKGIGIDPQDPDAITDFDTYHQGVVQELRARGYNAAYDGEELAVGRRGDGFSEQFDISTWQGRVRRFYAAHLSPAVWG